MIPTIYIFKYDFYNIYLSMIYINDLLPQEYIIILVTIDSVKYYLKS